jgi:5-methyltetrahydropteroyltriglutamate--homocysteine methyltransferase
MNTCWRADHVGSLLRPAELIQARLKGVDADTIRDLENKHIRRVLDKERELGLGIFTDGEFRRQNFMSDFIEAVQGFDTGDAVSRSWEGAAIPVSSVTGVVTEKFAQRRSITAYETSFLSIHSPGPFKITLPSATQFPAISFKWGVTDRVYPDHSALLTDVVSIMTDEMQRLKNAGVQYIQIDAPRYSYFIDPKWRDWIRAEMRQDPDTVLDEYVRADNACFAAARKPGLTLAIHLCRGNNRSHWYAEGGYDAIAEKLFNTLDVDRFLLEYDDERSGTFEPLRFVPRDKTVVLGLVSTKRPQLEPEDTLLKRIHEASKHVLLENLAVSPQCGFASTLEGNLLSEEEQWAKLGRVVEVADRVWG